MNILLIGGNGFIGSHITDWLIKNNHHVRIIDKSPEKYRKPLREVDYRFYDIKDLPNVMESMEGVDIVFHLVSTTVPSTSNVNIINDLEQNLSPSIRFLDILIQSRIKNIVYFSTGGAIYGLPHKTPIPETHPTEPLSSYGIVKLTMEKYLHLYEQNYDLHPLIIRPSNPYGPRQGHLAVQGVIATFLSKIRRDEELTVWGDGNTIRDYIYINNFVALVCQLALSETKGIYNIGSSVGYSVNQIIEVIKKVTNKKVKVNYQPIRRSDISKVVLDTTKLYQTVHPTDMITLEEGISLTWDWIRTLN